MPLPIRISRHLRNTKVRRLLLVVLVVLTIFSFSRSRVFKRETDEEISVPKIEHVASNDIVYSLSSKTPVKPINCLINQNYTVDCLRQEDEVLLPFSFVKNYFEIYGSFSQSDTGEDIYQIEHSTGFVKPPIQNYSATGIHADDVNYYVEGRHFVIYVDGQEGVPVCRQWFPEGFFFSTNIAQYGLSHYSQYVVEETPTIENVDIGASSLSLWKVTGSESTVIKEEENTFSYLSFKTSTSFDQPGIVLTFDEDQNRKFRKFRMYSLSSYVRFTKDSSITVKLTRSLKKEEFYIHYVFNTTKILVSHRRFTFGLGERKDWSRLSRNLYTDLETAIRHRDGKITTKVESNMRTIWSVDTVIVRGEGGIHNITLASSAHLEQFFDAANWLLKNQDEKGGWPMPVKRVLGTYTLQPGWYSSLSQGVCISMMARAYWITKDMKYLYSALNATKLFHITSEKGGVRATFMDRLAWYEEYPTVPASFVLNGFITALLGLYDLAKIAPPPYNADSQKLFDDGMLSLKTLLPLFDSGYRTLYDLRHLTMHTDPNLCRWDYHNLHVELLLYMSTIDSDPVFKTIGQRWNKYRQGWHCPHN